MCNYSLMLIIHELDVTLCVHVDPKKKLLYTWVCAYIAIG